jgi:predicted nucleic acid-binding protein
MIVVSDTTAITVLLKAGREHLLRELFGNVLVPQAVWDELLAFHSQLPEFVSLRPVAGAHQQMPEIQALGRGEAEAIQLAAEVKADLLLTDDLKARAVASSLKTKSAGLLGVMIHAKQAGRITSVREAIESLERHGGLYLSDAVKTEALKLAGEAD